MTELSVDMDTGVKIVRQRTRVNEDELLVARQEATNMLTGMTNSKKKDKQFINKNIISSFIKTQIQAHLTK
tara:strand:+ start:2502 stop:2714 length:213 start_codon:yes stop_codon:yes gene_type:complete